MKDTFDFDKIGKRMPYRTPDGFFDKMEEDVMNRLKEQDLKEETSSSVVGTADLIQAFNQLDDADQLELLSTYQSDVFMDE